jgi:lipoprotein-releasing system permease protein
LSPYELAVGLRYTRARKGSGRNTFISFISLISMAGITLGVAALIVVLSVMNGFQEELRNRILAVASHIEIRGVPQLMDWPSVAAQASKEPRVKAAAPYVLGQAMLTASGANRGALIRGIDPSREDAVADIGKHMRAGSLANLKPGEFGIVLGRDLAGALGEMPGDSVVVITPQGTITPAGTLPRLKSFKVVGIFDVGMAEFDGGLALVNIEDAQKLYRLDGVSGVRLKLDDCSRRRPSRATCGRSFRPGRDPRLDAQPREFLPRRADREARDVHHPHADRRGGGVQHRLRAGHGRDRQAGRHRDPAHARRVAVVDHGDLRRARRADNTEDHRISVKR